MTNERGHELVDQDKRGLLKAATAAVLVPASLVGSPLLTGGASAASSARTNGAHKAFDVRQVQAGELDCGYVDLGSREGPVALLLHGWPYDIYAFADVAPQLVAAGFRVIIPFLRGYGSTRFRADAAFRNGQQAVIATDMINLLDALQIRRAIVAGFDWGARTANIMAALWPERCAAMVSVSGYLIGSQKANAAPLPPKAELAWWYQFYFATERGRAGYAANHRDFNKLIWTLASPKWAFDDAAYEQTAAAFENPDHVAIVIHNYRWRLGLEKGDPKYDGIEARLAASPPITIPTITLEGDANGAPHPEPAAYAKRFTGRYEHRAISGGIGHNLPQEAPDAFARAVIDVARS